MQKPKIALIHEYLVQYGGAEKTLEAIVEIYPESPIYTGIYNPENLSEFLNKQTIRGYKSGILSKLQKYLTFLMPLVFESFDLTEFDIVISDGTAWPKGVLTTPEQLHISYIHTPPRFLYKYSVESQKRDIWYFKPFVIIIDFFLRIWDFYASQRPDYLLTNSKETQKRIHKFYNRNATVIYPPVDIEWPTSEEKVEHKDYYLILGRLAAYKNFDLVIKAFNQIDQNLVVVGTGTEEVNLKVLANNNIKFEGRVSENRKHALLENCKGVINPVEDEDLGIVPIEAMAHGKPVLAHKSGGHLETITEGISGMYFEKLNMEEFKKSFLEFNEKVTSNFYNSKNIIESVKKYNKKRFQQELEDFVTHKWKDHQNA